MMRDGVLGSIAVLGIEALWSSCGGEYSVISIMTSTASSTLR